MSVEDNETQYWETSTVVLLCPLQLFPTSQQPMTLASKSPFLLPLIRSQTMAVDLQN